MLEAHRFFLLAALLSGAAFIAVTPPFQVPDEPAHFYRAVAVGEGALSAEARAGRIGATLPASLAALVDLFNGVIGHPERGIDPGAFRAARRIALEPEVRSFLDFPTAAQTTPLTYLPQALGVAAGRLFGAPPLALLYLARLVNLLAATALIHAGLRRLPAYRWLGTALALTPMATFLRASASADALTFAIAFFFAAAVARLAFGPGSELSRRDVAVLCLAAAALCATKAAYAPLTIAAAAIPIRRLPRGRRAASVLAYGAATAAAFALAVFTALPGAYVADPRPAANPHHADAVIESDRQIAGAVRSPLRFLAIAGRSYLWYGPGYAEQFIGRLGWLDTPLPRPLLIAYAALLLALLAFDTRRRVAVAAWQRTALAAAAAGNLLLISAVFYALFMPVGSSYIAGIQGRYFLPIAPIAAWIFHTRRRAGPRRGLGPATALVCALALTATLVALIQRYYA